MLLAILFILFLVGQGVWALVAPGHFWDTVFGWQYANREANRPSDSRLALYRFQGVIALVVAAVLVFFAVQSKHDEAKREERAAQREERRSQADPVMYKALVPLGKTERTDDFRGNESILNMVAIDHAEREPKPFFSLAGSGIVSTTGLKRVEPEVDLLVHVLTYDYYDQCPTFKVDVYESETQVGVRLVSNLETGERPQPVDETDCVSTKSGYQTVYVSVDLAEPVGDRELLKTVPMASPSGDETLAEE